jgi:two-component system, chemotaxis family, protein-glutamate methylesterase/glutaminase
VTARVRVLVVDDSAFMRGAVARLISSDERFEVVGQARDGEEAVRLASELTPDVMTMDFNMPGLNGADATRAILAVRRVPIVMLSAHTRDGASATVEALAAGAVDFVTKPGGEVSADLTAIRDELVTKLLGAAGAKVLRPATGSRPPPPSSQGEAPVSRRPPSGEMEAPVSRRGLRSAVRQMPPGLRLVVVASSTGGPAALVRVVPALTIDEHAALLIVQHMPPGFTAALAEQLSERARFAVREAKPGDELAAGVALVAPGDHHLIVDRSGHVELEDSPPVHGVRPAADVTLKSVAQAYGARSVGVVLTGMGRDGALGLAAIKAAGGRTVAQNRESSTVYGMPRAAQELGVVDDVVALDRVADVVNKLIG